MRIAIVNYGMGNIHSISRTFKYLGVEEVFLSNNFDELHNADKLILPGVGSFCKAMKKIHEYGLVKTLNSLVFSNRKPILGICLGMQLLANSSTEDSFTNGLKFVNGEIQKFDTENELKIPHVGFNSVIPNSNSRLFRNLSDTPFFYFTHSYKMNSDEDIGQSLTTYGQQFISAFEFDNIAGVQFHPELSQKNGITLLQNFIELF
jgi:glutamine amidotransferase